ncbi:MAG: ATP-binding protein, partial [Psychrosphaera sp.]|nr:ATP-binding protein [Psychrosphaera sp.]
NQSITYAYQLAGIEPDWTYVSSQKRFANYTNIPPGEYTFRAKAKSKNDVWSDVEVGVVIVISPPWWRTMPAYFFYLVLVVLTVYIIVKVRTVTLLKRANQLEASVRQRTTELALEKKKVEQLLVKKDEEFANISHEFRTPLTLILGPAQQLIKQAKAAELDQLNIIERNGYRLLRMVDQLLNIETFKVEAITHKVTQHFAHSVQTIRLAFIPMAQNKNITIEIERVEPICAEFTQDAFEQILLNLLSNAIKYTQDGGAISLSLVRIKYNQLKLTVSDSGIGISKDQQQAIFSRFHRVHNAKTQHAVGTGIGLALVKSMVEAHQGNIEVQSEVGKGTQITLCFPIVNEVESEVGSEVESESEAVKINDELINKELKSIEPHPVQTKGADSENKDGDNASTTVLVIDDNADMLTYISANLLMEHQILTATNGREGLELAIEQVPDLIVSDVMMPEIDGYELADALRENAITAHIPIILLTAKGDTNSKIKGLNKQVDDYLTKPFDLQELKVRITNLLEIRKILRKRFAVARFGSVQLGGDVTVATAGGQTTEHEKFLTALDNILEGAHSDMELRVGSLADGLNISERQLFRKLKSTVDMSPTEYLRNFRLLKAAGLLRLGQKSTVVALEVGFSSASYFTKCFRAQFGVAPSEF